MKFLLPLIILLIGLLPISSTANVDRVLPVEETKIYTAHPSLLIGYTAISIKRGFILSEAFLNGQKGIFIIDTGAPQLVLNANKISGDPIQNNASGISASIDVGSINVENFAWSGINQKGIEALVISLDHLEEVLNLPIMGLIGYDVLKNHELLIDYDNAIAQVFKTDRIALHKPLSIPKVFGKEKAYSENGVIEIPFTLQDHLPVIEAQIGNRKLKLGLDTGSESNLIDEAFAKYFDKTEMKILSEMEIRGLDKEIHKTKSIELEETHVNGKDFGPMPYLLYPLQEKCAAFDIKIDGLLGAPFFQKGKFSIDYKKKKIYFYPTKEALENSAENISQFFPFNSRSIK